FRAFKFAAQRTIRCSQDEHPELRVVAGIRTGVVLLNMHPGMANAAYRPPQKSPEMHNQIGRDVSHLAIEFIRLEDERLDRLALFYEPLFDCETAVELLRAVV